VKIKLYLSSPPDARGVLIVHEIDLEMQLAACLRDDRIKSVGLFEMFCVCVCFFSLQCLYYEQPPDCATSIAPSVLPGKWAVLTCPLELCYNPLPLHLGVILQATFKGPVLDIESILLQV